MKNLWKTYPVAVISLGVCLVFAGVTFAFSWQLATVELLFLLGCLAFELLHIWPSLPGEISIRAISS